MNRGRGEETLLEKGVPLPSPTLPPRHFAPLSTQQRKEKHGMSLSLDRSLLKPVATVVAIVLSLFQIYFTGGFGVTDAHILRGTHLTLIMILVLLLVPSRKLAPGEKEGWFPILIDLALIALAIAINVYVFQEADNISRRLKYVEDVTNLDLFYGTGLVLLVLEATRRTSGWPLVIVSGSFLAYAMFGEYMPGGLAHNGIEYDRLIEQLFLLTDGIYGVPLGAAAGMIFAFVMFGAFLESSKMSSLFMDLACLLTRKSAGGPAKVSIFASALFGTISGSAAANVYGTGTFTIPLMKKVGYRAPFAGAVEAVASTGGQLMPPVMGTAAFLMADLSGAGYLNVAKAALLPAILYYLALLVMIHFEAVKNDLGKLSPDMVPETKSVVSRLYYLVPIAVLILLLGMGRSVVFCANIATLSIVLLAMLKAETRFTFKSFIEALVASSRGALMVSACCACSGLIVGVLSLTGIGYKFINLITILAGDSLFLLMVYLMLTSFVLGMGIPTTPAYIVVATLGAPALIKAGAPQLVAHMFVFYYAILSFITPPVCVAAFAGAAIAESKAMETGFIALKLGIVAEPVRWLSNVWTARGLVGLMNFLMWFGNTTIILMAAIMGVDPGLYEAAQLDGASSTTMFWRITIPLIRPLLVYTLITSLIGGLQMFDVPQVLTNGKGDPNGSTNTIIMYLNQHLYSKNYGTAGAISVLMFLLCAVLCVIIYFTLTQEDDGLTREQRKAEKARIKAAKAAAKHH